MYCPVVISNQGGHVQVSAGNYYHSKLWTRLVLLKNIFRKRWQGWKQVRGRVTLLEGGENGRYRLNIAKQVNERLRESGHK